MAFIINGADWNFNGLTPEQAEVLIDRALEFIEVSEARGQGVAIGDDFQTRPMYEMLTLWEMFSQASPFQVRRELSQELAAWLNKAPRYVDAYEWPDGFDDAAISIDGAPPSCNDDVAWVHHSVRAGIPAASLAIGATGIFTTETSTGSADLHFVSNDTERKHFWRDMILLEGDNLNSLLKYSSRAYPDLYFIHGVLEDAARLSGGYASSRHRVRNALEILDDWGSWAFTYPPPAIAPNEGPPSEFAANPTNQLIEHRFAGFGIDAAPEKPNVRNDSVCRTARETALATRTLYCEWHVKLEPHQNRIHFHPPVPESRDKVVIGIIHEHLPLP